MAAVAQRAYIDAELRVAGTPGRLLSGLTFCVKDLFNVSGHPTSFGSPAWRDSHPVATQHAAAVKMCHCNFTSCVVCHASRLLPSAHLLLGSLQWTHFARGFSSHAAQVEQSGVSSTCLGSKGSRREETCRPTVQNSLPLVKSCNLLSCTSLSGTRPSAQYCTIPRAYYNAAADQFVYGRGGRSNLGQEAQYSGRGRFGGSSGVSNTYASSSSYGGPMDEKDQQLLDSQEFEEDEEREASSTMYGAGREGRSDDKGSAKTPTTVDGMLRQLIEQSAEWDALASSAALLDMAKASRMSREVRKKLDGSQLPWQILTNLRENDWHSLQDQAEPLSMVAIALGYFYIPEAKRTVKDRCISMMTELSPIIQSSVWTMHENHIRRILWALSRMHSSDTELVDALAQRLLEVLDGAQVNGIAVSVWALASLYRDYEKSGTGQSLKAAAYKVLDRASENVASSTIPIGDVVNIAWAMVVFRYTNVAMTLALFNSAAADVDNGYPSMLNQLVFCVGMMIDRAQSAPHGATLREGARELFSSISPRLVHDSGEMNAVSTVTTIWSLACVEYLDEKLLSSLLCTLPGRLSTLHAAQVAKLLASLSKLHRISNEDSLRDLITTYTKTIIEQSVLVLQLGPWDLLQVSSIFNAMGIAQIVDTELLRSLADQACPLLVQERAYMINAVTILNALARIREAAAGAVDVPEVEHVLDRILGAIASREWAQSYFVIKLAGAIMEMKYFNPIVIVPFVRNALFHLRAEKSMPDRVNPVVVSLTQLLVGCAGIDVEQYRHKLLPDAQMSGSFAEPTNEPGPDQIPSTSSTAQASNTWAHGSGAGGVRDSLNRELLEVVKAFLPLASPLPELPEDAVLAITALSHWCSRQDLPVEAATA